MCYALVFSYLHQYNLRSTYKDPHSDEQTNKSTHTFTWNIESMKNENKATGKTGHMDCDSSTNK